MNVESFNEKFPVGSDVIYVDDFKKLHKTKTTSIAWEIGGGDILVKIEGRSGGYDIARIYPAEYASDKE